MRAAAVGGGTVVATGATLTALELAGAPWWAIVIVVSVMVTVGAVIALAQTFIPQESADKLEWWRDRRAHQVRLRRITTAVPRPRSSPTDSRAGGRRHTTAREGRP
jgi:cell division protein FtsW (lipid II flippase)